MKIGGGVLYGGPPRGSVLPLLFSNRPSSLRFTTAVAASSSSTSHVVAEHSSFVKDVAATHPPQHLSQLLSILKTRGESIISPGAKKGLIPLAIPLSKNSSGTVTALLRWPTAPPEMEMPVVEVNKYGVWLLAKSVDQFIHRILVEEDAKNSQDRNDELFHASADAGEKLYRKGDFAESKASSLDVYLLKKVGLFPDILERKVMRHFEEGDHVSALVTGEFYTKKEHFPGFARPFVFNAEVLLRVGRNAEAKDAARGALKSPWWTLGCKYRHNGKMNKLSMSKRRSQRREGKEILRRARHLHRLYWMKLLSCWIWLLWMELGMTIWSGLPNVTTKQDSMMSQSLYSTEINIPTDLLPRAGCNCLPFQQFQHFI
ncbi:protein IN CHLOROPLAST ATPASE BIOGENESIS, chloroplastic isoform X1 [Arachis duranensis]|uniref:Protein IN CHLOROPLAST ATPASE BIOGENESIS, chloroplastic isoform X1 n=1 Tax=Arachis duranensis TaxID=130453 RepID=A0A9C6WIZ1_ARADU|nr:protein IN CHLOROPLAST ATPASE BIOGENESIS, chloroplastic isoform X1 [Arachis duranensis]